MSINIPKGDYNGQHKTGPLHKRHNKTAMGALFKKET